MITIVDYTPTDRDQVVALVLEIQRGEFGVPITLADQPDLADIHTVYQRDRGAFWVARDDDEIVGTLGLLDAGECALRKMFVRKDRRSVHGVASRLLDKLLDHARAHAVPRLFLGTRPEMLAAHRFYEKNGFHRIDPEILPPAFPRMTLDSVFYRKDL
jgi:N-acetylglutamate synthase-like GNAT family acetyltransferase